MRGGRKQAKLACGRPLDGRVRRLVKAHYLDEDARTQASHSGGGQAVHRLEPAGPRPPIQAPPQFMITVRSGILR